MITIKIETLGGTVIKQTDTIANMAAWLTMRYTEAPTTTMTTVADILAFLRTVQPFDAEIIEEDDPKTPSQ